MKFVSYAQNFEDVMLWRALKDVERGVYVDVGANDPEVDSVTKAFYDRGWAGINIEPVPQWYEKLKVQRPQDINLQLAASNVSGEQIIYEISDTGLSTFDKSVAEAHETQFGFSVTERRVSVKPLAQILGECGIETIHFLKIDVEGAEALVLQGMDFSATRPWIVLVESTIPLSQIQSHQGWEYLLLGANYEFAYFDGLNRFYVASEKPDLVDFFQHPPNVFDSYVTRTEYQQQQTLSTQEQQISMQEQRVLELVQREHDLTREWEHTRSGFEERCESLASQLDVAKGALELISNSKQQIEQRLVVSEAREIELLDRLATMRQSTSWRLTMPVRVIKRMCLGDFGDVSRLNDNLRARLRRGAQRAAGILLRHPWIYYKLKPSIARFPQVRNQLIALAHRIGLFSAVSKDCISQLQPRKHGASLAEDRSELSPKGRKIYSTLKGAINRLEGE